jgi:uncharacterized membrane protein YcjF (UPF0283 family)
LFDPSDVDWSWLESINLFQIAVVIVAIYVVVRLLVRFWPWLRKVMDFTSALSQLATFIVRTDQTLADQNVMIERLRKQVENDHDENLRDELTSALQLAKETKEIVETHTEQLGGITEKLTNDHDRINKLEDTQDKAELRRLRDTPNGETPYE